MCIEQINKLRLTRYIEDYFRGRVQVVVTRTDSGILVNFEWMYIKETINHAMIFIQANKLDDICSTFLIGELDKYVTEESLFWTYINLRLDYMCKQTGLKRN